MERDYLIECTLLPTDPLPCIFVVRALCLALATDKAWNCLANNELIKAQVQSIQIREVVVL